MKRFLKFLIKTIILTVFAVIIYNGFFDTDSAIIAILVILYFVFEELEYIHNDIRKGDDKK